MPARWYVIRCRINRDLAYPVAPRQSPKSIAVPHALRLNQMILFALFITASIACDCFIQNEASRSSAFGHGAAWVSMTSFGRRSACHAADSASEAANFPRALPFAGAYSTPCAGRIHNTDIKRRERHYCAQFEGDWSFIHQMRRLHSLH